MPDASSGQRKRMPLFCSQVMAEVADVLLTSLSEQEQSVTATPLAKLLHARF